MTRHPVISFGMQAQAVAFKARTGRLRWRDQVALSKAALQWVPDQAPAREMVVDFLDRCGSMPTAAGEKLLEDLQAWLDATCPREPVNADQQYDWQKRADLQ